MSDDELFTSYERIERCERTEITAENIANLARHFKWFVDYSGDEPTLVPVGNSQRAMYIGAWIDIRGSRWNPDPLTQGWSPAGTFAPAGEAEA